MRKAHFIWEGRRRRTVSAEYCAGQNAARSQLIVEAPDCGTPRRAVKAVLQAVVRGMIPEAVMLECTDSRLYPSAVTKSRVKLYTHTTANTNTAENTHKSKPEKKHILIREYKSSQRNKLHRLLPPASLRCRHHCDGVVAAPRVPSTHNMPISLVSRRSQTRYY